MITPKRYDGKRGTTWRITFRHKGRTTSETFDTKKEAERFANELALLGSQDALERLYDGEQKQSGPTLDQIASDHIEHLTDVTVGTRLSYQRLWARTWSEKIGNLPADRVTRDHISKAVIALAERYSYKSLKNQRGLLYGVLDRAVDLGHLDSNPAKKVRIPRSRETDRTEMVILDQADIGTLISHLPQHWRPLVQFLAGTGCRWGEAVALQVGDVMLNTDTPVVRIRRALKWSPDGNREVGPTKTKKSNRTVALPAVVAETLVNLVDGRGKGDLVFTAPRGGPVRHRTFWSDIWLPACKKAGFDPRPRIHDLRHSHASILLGQGVPIHVVQARLGHESIQTTVDTYSSLLPDAQVAAAAAADHALTPPSQRGLPSAD